MTAYQLLEEMKNGNTIKWQGRFPRYYKLENGEVFYTDNTEHWSNSSLTENGLLEMLQINYKKFEVL